MLTAGITGLQVTAAAAQASSPSEIEGVWETVEGNFKFEVYDAGGSFAARVIYGDRLMEADGKTFKKDIHNPDPKLRGRSLEGITFPTDLRWDRQDRRWEDGKFYDGRRGAPIQGGHRCEMVRSNCEVMRGRRSSDGLWFCIARNDGFPGKPPQFSQSGCEPERAIACGGVLAERLIFAAYIVGFFGAIRVGGEAYRWNEALPGLYDPSSRLSTIAIGAHFVAGSILVLLGPVRQVAAKHPAASPVARADLCGFGRRSWCGRFGFHCRARHHRRHSDGCRVRPSRRPHGAECNHVLSPRAVGPLLFAPCLGDPPICPHHRLLALSYRIWCLVFAVAIFRVHGGIQRLVRRPYGFLFLHPELDCRGIRHPCRLAKSHRERQPLSIGPVRGRKRFHCLRHVDVHRSHVGPKIVSGITL
ncbi:Hypothetical protein NGAL_HAMBI490_50500 [Neorhizobium galegae bv. officinalis]|nr:Hypothetical protein NGAL_HAMBI490_50500 [Neorhizobium galegae bv. officinalis]